MAATRAALLLLLLSTLTAHIHAGSFFLRDDIEGFPEVVPGASTGGTETGTETGGTGTGTGGTGTETGGTGGGNGTETGGTGGTGTGTGGTGTGTGGTGNGTGGTGTSNETPGSSSEEEEEDLGQELEQFHCDPLESLLEEFVNASALDFYFDMMFDSGMRPPVENKDELFGLFADATGYDLRLHDGRHRLACALYGIEDTKGLASFLGLPLEMVDMIYEIFQDTFNEMGGMNTINVYSQVSYEFSTWVMESGFPDMPLKAPVDVEEIRDKMREWQTAIFNLDLERHTKLMDMLDSTIAPFKIMPEYTAKVLSTSKSTEQMLEKLCISQHAYLVYKQYSDPQQMQALLDFTIITVRLLNEFNDMGLFNLPS